MVRCIRLTPAPNLLFKLFSVLYHDVWHALAEIKACVCDFLSNFYIFTKWQSFKNYEKCFLFHQKSSFRPRDIRIFVIFSLPFHSFQIQNDRWKWNYLWRHQLACINLLMQFLEYLKNCFTLHHQTWSDNI